VVSDRPAFRLLSSYPLPNVYRARVAFALVSLWGAFMLSGCGSSSVTVVLTVAGPPRSFVVTGDTTAIASLQKRFTTIVYGTASTPLRCAPHC
jgi:hypothetical protein